MKTVIVDDEPPARDLLKEYLSEFEEIEVVAECKNGREAVTEIHEQDPDLVFLDVQMPGLDGFDVLEQLEHVPPLIFSTAYDEYAIQAFEAGAVDYLLKPYKRERFRKAVRRALQRKQPAGDLTALLEATRQKKEPLRRLFVRTGEKIVPVDTDDVRWIEAAGDYAKLHLADGRSLLCNLGIGALEERLDADRFLRVHRSTLIALPALKHLTSDGQGGYRAVLHGGDRVRVSRSYAEKLRKLMH